MPYVSADDRPVLDKAVEALAEDVIARLAAANGDTDISVIYRQSFLEIAQTLVSIEGKASPKANTAAARLAAQVFGVAEKYGYNGAWLGELNYSITRLIQVVPRKMVEKGRWKEELRYWLYAQTAGSLVQSASDLQRLQAPKGREWVLDGLVGVMTDIKDEYKRRVNAAYEAVQIRKSGDVYTAPFRTELVDVTGPDGKVAGWQEIMKDFRQPSKARAKATGE